MTFDLDQLRLDIPTETFDTKGGGRPFWRAAALALFAACIGLVTWNIVAPSGDSGAISVTVHVVAPQAAGELAAFTAGGWVEPAWPFPTTVSAQVDGRLEKLEAVEGQVVRQGDLLAVLHNLPWRQAAIDAEAEVAAAEAEVEEREATVSLLRAGHRPEELTVAAAVLQEAQANLALLEAGYRSEDIAMAAADLEAALVLAAQRERDAVRSEVLCAQQLLSRAAADRDRAVAEDAKARARALEAALGKMKAGPRAEEISLARAAVQSAQSRLQLLQAGYRAEEINEAAARLDAARARLEQAEARLEMAQRDVGYCLIRAPADGVVLDILSPQGTWLHGDMRGILRLYDAAQMQARVDVRQENAATLALGQKCSIKLESRRDLPYMGQVIRVDPQGNLARDTVRVRVMFDAPDEFLRIDLTVTVDFLPPEVETGIAPLVVPSSAVFKRDGRYHVFAVRGGAAKLLAPELGRQTSSGFEVLSGLDAGEVVATGNLAMLADGTPVRLAGDEP